MEAARPPLESTTGGRRLGILTVLLVAVGLVLIAAVGYVLYERYLARPAIPPISGTPVEVRRGSIESVVGANGTVALSKYSKLGMSVGGRIKELPVRSGDSVKAGAVLARLETTPLELRLAQARSQLRTAQLRVDAIKSPPRPEDVAQAEAVVTGAQGKLSDLQSGSLPQDIAQAQAQADNAAAMVRQAQARLDSLRSGATQADVSAAEQSLKAAQANVDKSTADLARIKTPNEDELAPLRINVEKAEAAVRTARANFDKFAWRPDIAARPESVALAQATADLEAARAALQLKQQPRQTDVDAAQRAVDSSQAQVAAAQARIDQLHSGPSAEDVRAAQAAVDGASATYQQASSRVAGLQAGAKPGEIQAAQALVAQAQQQLALKKQPATPQDVALAEEQVNLAQIAVQQAQLDLDNAVLTAPFDGLVTEVAIGIGEAVSTAQVREFVTLIDPRSTKLEVSVDETDIGKIAVDNPATLTFDAMPGKSFPGKVTAIATGAVVQGGIAKYVVTILPDDRSIGLQPGMTASATILVGKKDNVLVVPTRAVKRSGRDAIVDLKTGDRTQPRAIKTGLSDGKVVEVLDGLTESDTVVIPAMSTVAPRGAQPPPNPLAPAAPRPAGKP
jgi:HlyD family secretion protein